MLMILDAIKNEHLDVSTSWYLILGVAIMALLFTLVVMYFNNKRN